MIFQFKDRFPQLNLYWDKYLEFQKRKEVPAKTVLLKEGKISQVLLSKCFEEDNHFSKSIPTVQYLAETLNYTPNYLSDMLRSLTRLKPSSTFTKGLLKDQKIYCPPRT